MRTWISGLVVVGLVSLSFGGAAGANEPSQKKRNRTERVLQAGYDGPTFGAPTLTTVDRNYWLCYAPNTCPFFSAIPGDRFISVKVEDASGTPTAFGLFETEGGPHYGNFCGSTGDKPIRLKDPNTLIVTPYAFGDVVCPGSFGTTGNVIVTFSNRP